MLLLLPQLLVTAHTDFRNRTTYGRGVKVKEMFHVKNAKEPYAVPRRSAAWVALLWASSPKRSQCEMKRGEDGAAVKIAHRFKVKSNFGHRKRADKADRLNSTH